MIGQLWSAAIRGVEGLLIEVEVDLSDGLPKLTLVGLPDASVKESRERIRSALKSCGLKFPSKRIVINLAPADLKKEGALYDLPMSLALLAASKQIEAPQLKEFCVMGELSLDGRVKPIKGVLPMVMAARKEGKIKLILPADNAAEAALVQGVEIYAVQTLNQAVEAVCAKRNAYERESASWEAASNYCGGLDMADVKGQPVAKRALEIAAAGAHNILFVGSPGSGKSMLAKRLPSILPALDFDQALECTKIHSVMGLLPQGRLMRERFFRSPHHSISPVALVGGGQNITPGEITLAHNGVLFLDELPEFQRSVLEVMRQPLEDRVVNIARASGSLTFPASIMLVAAMNPCPCGFLADETKTCYCSESQIARYRSKISGPLLDRIDMHIEVPAVRFEDLSSERMEESSSEIRLRVERTRAIQKARGYRSNATMSEQDMERYCRCAPTTKGLLKSVVDDLGYSARAYSKLLKLARTIADMSDEEIISEEHVLEAVHYRVLDRESVLG